ncbi:MAG: MmgE/PrpD family protein [Ramlibacter sp.]|jgi:2-methylcitrate dehydratase PrpD|nr:MmgE/PrpD family protein [Ramlibacter sp.]
MGLTESLARLTAGRMALSGEAEAIIAGGFIDAIGCMLAGAREPAVEAVLSVVRARAGGPAPARLLLGAERASPQDAALVNGTAAHALDYDDVALTGHPSAVLVPALLAEGERCDARGEAVMEAYLTGYEVWAELVSRDQDPYHDAGWHSTSVVGTVAAAAAVARLNELDEIQSRHSLAIASSMASGLLANFGTMMKPVHAGRAASCGIEAVRLAQAGLAASATSFEGEVGFVKAYSPRGRIDREAPTRTPQNLWLLEHRLSIKKYPLCYATHRVVDAVIDLARQHRVAASDVAAVHATVGVSQAAMLYSHAPDDPMEAKFSLEFAVAAALVAGRVGLAHLQPEFIRREDVRQLMKKVVTHTCSTRCPVAPAFSMTDQVMLTLHDGRSLRSPKIRFARGDGRHPLVEGELEAKFLDCAGPQATRLLSRLKELRTLPSLRTLCLE